MLVRVLSPTTPYLHLDTIGVQAIGDVQAFIAEDLDHTAGEYPLLGWTAIAWLDGDPSAVVIRGGGKTFAWARFNNLVRR